MEKENILNKIRNLLDLASDKNSQHEAEAAARKAQALIMKYNVEEAELRGGKSLGIDEIYYPAYKLKKPSECKWLPQLFSTVAEFNFCKVLRTQRYKDGEWKEFFIIMGEADNVELVKFLSEQLTHRFRSIRKKEWKRYGGPDSYAVYLNAFFKGCVRGLYVKLEEQWEQFSEQESTALVITKNNEQIEKYMDHHHPKVKKGRSGSISSSDGYIAGLTAGQNANINAGLKGQAGSRLLN